jgi:LPXTG-motif cell wall-anchored protein
MVALKRERRSGDVTESTIGRAREERRVRVCSTAQPRFVFARILWVADVPPAFREGTMDTTTLLVIVIVVLLLGGGGFFYRGRR